MSSASYTATAAWSTPIPGACERTPFDAADDLIDPMGLSPESTVSSLFAAISVLGTSPNTPCHPLFPCATEAKQQQLPISAAVPSATAGTTTTTHGAAPSSFTASTEPSLLHMSLATLLGCCEMLGHHMEDRSEIARQQDIELLQEIQGASAVELRDHSQRPLFVVAPLDVLVTREATTGRNQFHIIEINGTGISGLTNLTEAAVEDVLRSFSDLAAHMTQPDVLVLVASSGQETYPPVSRTLHEKMLYVEALKRGFEATGRRINITNMTRLEKRPESMPASGPTVVLGYMKQFRANFMMDGPTGRLMLFGRQVHAAINDRFVLNTCYQFDHRLDLNAFRGYNAGYAAGADKSVAYELYNQFFGSEELGAHFQCMAPAINFRRARTRTELISSIQTWLQCNATPAVIKPQGTGCGHGIEFFFGNSSWGETAAKVDRALHSVASNYNLQCGGLPYTVCEYLDTATIDAPAGSAGAAAAGGGRGGCGGGGGGGGGVGGPHPNKVGHKFELRIVVYRAGSQLRAFPSIAKVAREAFDPRNPDNKKSLINNITTSAKETAQSGQEFLLPLCNSDTLAVLGISRSELAELCVASTHFIRYLVDQVQDNPALFGLPAGGE
ncbi:hypothetical protein VOLCADRAFT_120613 [Volvox carteri f. nagariensis]|uniref:Uncharacterized protein n=1 Tax=Volvox carteri f. nagariensis TaxID=3068 RepID=D8TPM4_VOLCA|nr:uncharacterized protein VOLCADRAFT_120613 [Volvox carteri f. nagariensis]EFJ50644.1 hypothetical protein VOLCADRAFT_120613 [Volvox carteri f. nagariensis]|eukprot:XP_002948237.1 hypothetical protein VOLCADRAFT_120613 [Volvox carteri f. nagariensis]